MRRNLIGCRFERLEVVAEADDIISRSGYRTACWECKCDCGNNIVVRGKSLMSGETKSCGCLQKELASARLTKHGGFGSRLYAVWNSMRQRCNNPNHHAYKNYGGRGIRICSEWDDFEKFKYWAIQNGYDETAKRGECTLDRIDVNGNYCPENCRWANMKEQSSNRRDSIILNLDGQKKSLMDWADVFGVNYCTAWKRFSNGRPVEDVFADHRLQ